MWFVVPWGFEGTRPELGKGPEELRGVVFECWDFFSILGGRCCCAEVFSDGVLLKLF